MDEKRLVVAAIVWSVGVFMITYMYRLTITDSHYATYDSAEIPASSQQLSQQ